MGQQLTKPVQFPKSSWHQFKIEGNTCIYQNQSGSFAQKKQLNQDKKLQAQQELKIYKERSETELSIVKVYNAQLQQQKKNFCSTSQKITVWIEYIPNRLSSIKSFTLNQAECLYVLQQSIKAFHELFKKFGYFEIKSDKIGFNVQGKVKCWINRFFQSNRIQNANDSILSVGDGPLKNINALDSRLRESIEKGMISNIWQIVKKKSNIQSEDFFYRLSGLQSSNFQNSLKLIQLLINKTQTKVPEYLYFQNCLEIKKTKYCQFSYSNVYSSQNSNIKFIQVNETQILKNGTFNFHSEVSEPNFKNFELYRDHINSLERKAHDNNCTVSISFQKVDHKKENKRIHNPQYPDQKKSTKNVLKLIDKTFDISLSSIPFNPSNKTISVQSEPTEKKIKSEENLFLPLQTIQKSFSTQDPVVVTSERCMLNEIPSNSFLSRLILLPQKGYQPYETNSIVYVEEPEPLIIENYPPVFKRTSSRFIPPPPPIQGTMKRQSSTIAFSGSPKIPQFTKDNRC